MNITAEFNFLMTPRRDIEHHNINIETSLTARNVISKSRSDLDLDRTMPSVELV